MHGGRSNTRSIAVKTEIGRKYDGKSELWKQYAVDTVFNGGLPVKLPGLT